MLAPAPWTARKGSISPAYRLFLWSEPRRILPFTCWTAW